MTIAKITGAVSPIEEAEKINELVDGVNAAAVASDVETSLSAKQDTLVSGTNIKTVNNNSLLGNGDLTIATAWGDIGGTLSNQTDLATGLADAANNVYTVLAILYPVGSVYIGTQSTCPLATLISGSTWELVSSGRVLQGADNDHAAGTTIAAGLPNITGSIFTGGTYGSSIFLSSSGFVQNGSNSGWRTSTVQYSETGASDTVSFDASRSSSIYGQSNTVQPPAYVVNIWRRTA